MRTLKGRAINLAHTFLDDDEETALDFTAVSVTLTDSLGVDVSTVAATEQPDKSWTVQFPMQDMGVYTVTWNADTGTAIDETFVEVVGGYLFSVPQARASDEDLEDATKFPATEIIDYREKVETEFQKITGRSFTTRVVTFSFEGDDSREYLHLIPDAQAIEYVDVDGVVPTDAADWKVSKLGKITAPADVTDGAVVTVKVRYGFATPPADIQEKGMIRLRSLMAAKDTGIPDRAMTWQPNEGGTFRLATPGLGKWKTGIPEVDSTLANYSLDVVLAVYGVG